MLDIETRRRIDSARDILVGKVPDPKAQVEQITTALVYKFMDDMDKESIELGGKAQFFRNGYSRYSWSKLMDSRLGGHERLALYGEAITKMSENPNIPQLFRNIFKDAFLPYRDPETLNLFLKEINGFIYDHSERLGDAYEYLLSVLGSQGDAGQFRTPRHIIDFIVKVVDPDKTETILDPACGTAGFLISAFKHILGKYRKNKPGDLMTPAERKKFMGNFAGYDISPDMVRIALVNMYLHGFPNPNIPEYDTLTSEEKWDELYDVILANPPFMSPKGGIRPHKRFSVQATRSEVLFVDYIMEHLTKDGRAGVIVPEGIIFQSQTAYKELRRKLVEENYLYAVVSLPAGVFNPYSGVKTSILLLDRRIARERDNILFVKVENDGFDLGAQRREIAKNDLTNAKGLITQFRDTQIIEHSISHVVKKDKVLQDHDMALTGDRYLKTIVTKSTHPFVSVGEIFRKSEATVLPEKLKGPVAYIGLENISQGTGNIEGNVISTNPSEIKSLKCTFTKGQILYGKLRPNLNKVWLADCDGICSTDI
jgi:type I restriction enzyme M protein